LDFKESNMIGVIVPCYRMKKYLPVFLEELPLQSCINEVKVFLDLNDPDDEELFWIEKFNKQYPNILDTYIQRPVEPIGTSMNRCIERSSGCDYLALWNVDDLRTSNSLELQSKILKENNDIGVVCGNFTIVTSWGTKVGQFIDHTSYSPMEYFRSMLLGPFFMFRRNLITKTGFFDEQLRSGADFDLAIRLAYHSKIMCLPHNLGYYLNEGRGASTRGNLQPIERTVIEIRYNILDKIQAFYINEARKYDIDNIKFKNNSIPVKTFLTGV